MKVELNLYYVQLSHAFLEYIIALIESVEMLILVEYKYVKSIEYSICINVEPYMI